MLSRRLTAIAATAAAAGSLGACGSDSSKDDSSTAAAAGGPSLSFDLDEYHVTGPATAKAGSVSVTAKNTGHLPHELVIVKTDKPADQLGGGSQVPETGSVGKISDLGAGASGTKTVALTPGHYALICNIAGHYAAGMHADLTVE